MSEGTVGGAGHEPELGHLEGATEKLVEQVGVLSAALQAIGQVQAQQVELQQQVRAVREDVKENAVPKHQFEEAERNAATARARLQMRIRVFAIVISLLALAVSIGSGVLAVRYVHGQRVQTCKDHNTQVRDQHDRALAYIQPFLDQEASNPKADPILVDLFAKGTQAKPQLTDCSKL